MSKRNPLDAEAMESENTNEKKSIKDDRDNSSKVKEDQSQKSYRNRLTWIFLFLCIFAGFGYHSQDLLQIYLSYQVYYNADPGVKYLPFPDITFCHGTYVTVSRYPNYQNRLLYYANSFVNRTKGGVAYFDDILDNNGAKAWRYAIARTIDFTNTTLEEKDQYVQALKQTFIDEMSNTIAGPLLSDMFLSCTFNGQMCNIRNFSTFYNSKWSTCHTFTPDRQNFDYEEATRSGLQVIIDGGNFKSLKGDLSSLSMSSELLVYLSAPGEWPSFDTPQLEAPSTSSIAVKITPKELVHMNMDHDRCRPKRMHRICSLHWQRGRQCHMVSETKSLCQQLAIQRDLASKCGCISYEWGIPEDLNGLPTCHQLPRNAYVNRGYYVDPLHRNDSIILLDQTVVPVTNVVNFTLTAQRFHCYIARKKQWTALKSSVSCNRYCSAIEYTMKTITRRCDPLQQTTLSYFLNINTLLKGTIQGMYDQYVAADLPVDQMTNVLKAKREPFTAPLRGILTLRFTLDQPKGTVSQETLVFDLTTLFANIGGTVGLWIGASVITVFEGIEFLIGFIQSRLKKRKTK